MKAFLRSPPFNTKPPHETQEQNPHPPGRVHFQAGFLPGGQPALAALDWGRSDRLNSSCPPRHGPRRWATGTAWAGWGSPSRHRQPRPQADLPQPPRAFLERQGRNPARNKGAVLADGQGRPWCLQRPCPPFPSPSPDLSCLTFRHPSPPRGPHLTSCALLVEHHEILADKRHYLHFGIIIISESYKHLHFSPFGGVCAGICPALPAEQPPPQRQSTALPSHRRRLAGQRVSRRKGEGGLEQPKLKRLQENPPPGAGGRS